jgi:hypothetical protein
MGRRWAEELSVQLAGVKKLPPDVFVKVMVQAGAASAALPGQGSWMAVSPTVPSTTTMAPAHASRTPEFREKPGLLLERSVGGREPRSNSFIRTVCLFLWTFTAGPINEDLPASSHTPPKGAIVKSDDDSAVAIGTLFRTVSALLVLCPNRKI